MRHSRTVLLGLLALCFGVAALAGAVTSRSVDVWYPTLAKPGFTPPEWMFGPVWSVLYALMAIAAWRVWRRAGLQGAGFAFLLFGLQLALNLEWTILFFGQHAIGWALADMVVLLLLIVATMSSFWRIDRIAGLLFLPYVLWVGYAMLLNAAIWYLN
jgi:benzodiazapine receptor